MPARRRRLRKFGLLGVSLQQATEVTNGQGMGASYEPQDADREAVRPRSAPAFCQPQPAPTQPLRPALTVRPKPRPASRPPAPETVAVLPKTATPYAATPAVRSFAQPEPQETRKIFAASLYGLNDEPVRTLWGEPACRDESDGEGEPPSAAHWTSLARGVALLLGTLLAVALFGEGGLHEAGPWWLDTRPLPVPVAAGLLGLNAAFLIVFAAAGRLPGAMRGLGMFCVGLLIAVALKNTTIYYGLLQRGDLYSGPSVAFGLHIVASFCVVLFAMRTRHASSGVPSTLLVLVGAGAALLSFPIAQIACTGSIDARQPASAAIVFGPRPFEVDTGRLGDRVATAAELYAAGLVPTLVLTGSSNEQLAEMQQEALRRGVPAAAIELIDETDTATAIARLDDRFPTMNAREQRLLVVSDADHLPRITVEGRQLGLKLSPVPAQTSKPGSPGVLLREIGELWRLYLRG